MPSTKHRSNEWRTKNRRTIEVRSTFTANSIALLVAFVIRANAIAADLHPIVEVQSGYLFGATANGKWMKAEEAAKALPGETTYQVYGLTQSLGEAKGGKPKAVED